MLYVYISNTKDLHVHRNIQFTVAIKIYTMKLKVSQSKTLNQFSTHAIGGKNTETKDCIINLISMIISYMYNENALVDT